jgi:hypothetical protein
LITNPQRSIRAGAVFLPGTNTYSLYIAEPNTTRRLNDASSTVIQGIVMNRNHLLSALVLAVAGSSAFAQEATSDNWQQVAAVKSVEQVRSELAQARKDGSIKSWSAGYIETVASTKSRDQLRAEVAAARRSGELDSIHGEAYAFAPAATPSTVLASK